jgi:hypothetical protein
MELETYFLGTISLIDTAYAAEPNWYYRKGLARELLLMEKA